MRAPKVPAWLTPTFGAASVVLVTTGLTALVVATRRQTIDDGWLGVVLALMIAGVLLAWIGRVGTAGVVGANIGGGLALSFGLPLCGVLIGWAIFRFRRILRSGTGAWFGSSAACSGVVYRHSGSRLSRRARDAVHPDIMNVWNHLL